MLRRGGTRGVVLDAVNFFYPAGPILALGKAPRTVHGEVGRGSACVKSRLVGHNKTHARSGILSFLLRTGSIWSCPLHNHRAAEPDCASLRG